MEVKKEENPYLEFLESKSLQDDVRELIEYGINHLPLENERPNSGLAEYFFRLSEIENLDAERTDLLTDVFLYCKNGADFPVPSHYEEIKRRYENIKPSR